MNEIVGNLQPLVVINPPMRKVVDLSESKREKAEQVAKDLGSWLGEQGFNTETHGRVVDSNGPPTEIQNRIESWFGHSEHQPTFSEEKVLTDFDESFDVNYNPPQIDITRAGQPRYRVLKLPMGNKDDIERATDRMADESPNYFKSDYKMLKTTWDKSTVTIRVDSRDYELAKIILRDEGLKELGGQNPAYRFPKAESVSERVIQGMAAVKLSQLPSPHPDGCAANEKELKVCCEPVKNPPQVDSIQDEFPNDISKKCDICGEPIANEDEIVWHYQEKHPEVPQQGTRVVRQGDPKCQHKWRKTKLPAATIVCDDCGRIEGTKVKMNPAGDEEMEPEDNPRYTNRHYTDKERSRIMRTPEFKHWLSQWKKEKKAEPKQGWLHAFMSDVGHHALTTKGKWADEVRYSDRQLHDSKGRRGHYLKVATGKRTISGKPAIREISSNPQEDEIMEEEIVETPEEIIENPGHICPNDDTPLVSMGERCPKCGYERGSKNPTDKRGHYRKANPYDMARIDEAVMNAWKVYVEEVPPADGEELEEIIPGFLAYAKSQVYIKALRTMPPDFVIKKKNPPTHEHTLKYLGVCNPKGSNESKDLYECTDCKKKFIHKKV